MDDNREARMTTPGEVFASARLILLDFDGPVTRLLPPPANRELADNVRRFAKDQGVSLTDEEETTTDHLAIIRAASRTTAARDVEAYGTAAEVEAARRSPLTPGIRELLESARNNGAEVVIVTNNSPDCATTFFMTHQLMGYISAIIGRDPDHIDRMKPSPFILQEGMRRSRQRPAVMIGD